jgi:hypothetical protein
MAVPARRAVAPSEPSERELEALLDLQERTATRAQLLEHVSEEELRWFMASGRWQVPHPGVVVAHSGPLSEMLRVWVALLGCGRGAALAGLTAAGLDGLTGQQPKKPQLLVPHRRQVTDRDDIEIHSSTRLGSADVHPLRTPRRTRLPRSLVDAASWAGSDDEARAILAAGVQQRLVRVTDLDAVVALIPNLPRRRVIRLTLRDIKGGAHSLPEVEFAGLCRTFKLPPPSRQVVRRDASGRRRWLDVFWDDFGLVVEIDGLFHMAANAWWRDMWRGNDHTVALEGVLRYPSFAIREEPERVARQIAAALRARGWKG